MTEPLTNAFYMLWALALFGSLIALLEWKRRRDTATRRVARGLRSYTEGTHAQAAAQAEVAS